MENNQGGHYEEGDKEQVLAQRRLSRWPSLCPVCNAKPGDYCVSLHTGKRVSTHKSRPTN